MAFVWITGLARSGTTSMLERLVKRPTSQLDLRQHAHGVGVRALEKISTTQSMARPMSVAMATEFLSEVTPAEALKKCFFKPQWA